jgi:hypothetical protein
MPVIPVTQEAGDWRLALAKLGTVVQKENKAKGQGRSSSCIELA